jgi:hypothetical protein
MRERAAALGGRCEAGPVDGTGWRVRAEIPVGGIPVEKTTVREISVEESPAGGGAGGAA